MERINDKELEKLWLRLRDVPVDYDRSDCLGGGIDEDFHIWTKGTDLADIWRWFDNHHSKGVGWLTQNVQYRPN